MLLVAVLIFLSTVFGGEDEASAVDRTEFTTSTFSTPSTTTTPYPAGTCESAWYAASTIPHDDPQPPELDLDPAIRACQTLADWNSQAVKYPQLLLGRDPILVLSNRCLTGPTHANLCQQLPTRP